MDKKVAVKMNTSNQTINISLDGSDEPPLYANMAQMEVMKQKPFVIPKGQSATISIENSYPTVMFAGTFQFKLPLQSRSWKTLFDSSIFKPKQVFGQGDNMMFIDQNDEIWAVGKGLEGKHDEGWIRKLKKPANCSDIKKAQVIQYEDKKTKEMFSFRVLLTNDGRLFVHGDGFKDVLQLVNDSENALDQFKEVDVKKYMETLPPINQPSNPVVTDFDLLYAA